MYALLKKIYPLRLAPVSEDADRVVRILSKELPFKIHEFPSGAEHNGWIVPKKWKAVKAFIRKGNSLIYDGMKHPLGVVGYSTSFKRNVNLKELKAHLFYHPKLDDALVYHCDYYYKPWKKNWGLSVPHSLFRRLKRGYYEVDLETRFEDGRMKVLDYTLEGEKQDTIILNAHNCHAAQANDDIAGVVVGIEVMKRLRKLKKRRFSYRLIVGPEHLGTAFYLSKLSDSSVKNLRFAIFLEMLGTNKKFALQQSFNGESLIDKAAHSYFRNRFPDYHWAEFRKIVGNDETVWESPGYEIPCISISRLLYDEYHSDKDNENIISENKLEESVRAILSILDILETNSKMKRRFKGLIALSNPRYDLYIGTVDPSVRSAVSSEQKKWNYLMDCLTRYFDQKMTILDIATKHDLDYFKLYEYINKFREKGLISFVQK